MKISNPVLTGFHPDPSILKVGDTYYLANSTFEWFPGVELSWSKDLVHWNPIPSPLQRKEQLDMTGCEPSCGIWAPCLSYSGGTFYLIYTNVRTWNRGPWKDTPNFLVTATDINGPWSDPIYLNSSGFDPSLFHDDDGRKWLVNMEWDYRYTAEKQFTGILLQEYDPEKKCLVGEVTKIFTGTEIARVEGPHLYKKDGWYYLLAAEGGTFYEHAATIARSRSIYGPYEVHPQNPLISSYHDDTLEIKKAGHASFCDYKDGLSILAFLCGRPLPGTRRCILGRETSLAVIRWKDGWPYVVQNDGTLRNTPEACIITDGDETAAEIDRSRRYTLRDDSFWQDFKVLRSDDNRKFMKVTEEGLRIRGGDSPCSFFHKALLARRQTDFCFTATTCVRFSPTLFQHMAGLVYYYDENLHYYLAITEDEKKGKVIKTTQVIGGVFSQGEPVSIEDGKDIYLRLSVKESSGTFSYSYDGKVWTEYLKDFDTSVLSDDYFTDGFTGAFIGMMVNDTERHEKEALFSFFDYEVEK